MSQVCLGSEKNICHPAKILSTVLRIYLRIHLHQKGPEICLAWIIMYAITSPRTELAICDETKARIPKTKNKRVLTCLRRWLPTDTKRVSCARPPPNTPCTHNFYKDVII